MALVTRGNKSSPGMDGINYALLHHLPINYHLLPLAIMNQMHDENYYPHGWRTTFVHFVDKPNGNGLRPLALTSCISKVLELMLANRLRWWLERKNLIPLDQSGFRKGYSCMYNLLTLKLDIEDILRTKQHLVAAFLDVSNAFNEIHSDILIAHPREHYKKYFERTLHYRT